MAKKISLIGGSPWKQNDDPEPDPAPQQDGVGDRLDKIEKQIEELKKIVVALPDTLQQLLTT